MFRGINRLLIAAKTNSNVRNFSSKTGKDDYKLSLHYWPPDPPYLHPVIAHKIKPEGAAGHSSITLQKIDKEDKVIEELYFSTWPDPNPKLEQTSDGNLSSCHSIVLSTDINVDIVAENGREPKTKALELDEAKGEEVKEIIKSEIEEVQREMREGTEWSHINNCAARTQKVLKRCGYTNKSPGIIHTPLDTYNLFPGEEINKYFNTPKPGK